MRLGVKLPSAAPRDIAVTMLVREDVPAVYEVHSRTLDALPASNLVRRDEPDDFYAMFDQGGAIIGLTESGRLVGYGMVRPEEPGSDDRKGVEDYVTARESVFVLDGSAVLPTYWSRGLQRTLIDARLDFAVERGAEHAVCTAAPNNVPSMRNLTKQGFRIVRAAQKTYGMRYLLWRPAAQAMPRPGEAESDWRAAEDIAGANALFDRGCFAYDAIRGDCGQPFLHFVLPTAVAGETRDDAAPAAEALATFTGAPVPEAIAPR
ncbi:GNAT family N-acetyltransferase [Acuticoccus sp. I52.16.1]|uniref:GNAT family N-acetyltransferase n=1 Tax=Acuticoccus sp. I52.16.1 TaxID=2928472 RepID=UPI001FD623C5|nr:GNAT family N-acetyltransferase [Acuticoccus sp. I52.16.1]UOM32905.1 GNAT family N-acetyltransferase [Acuticoccus sp. I52.16.1]